MEVKAVLEKLEKSSNFKRWKDKNKGTYFSYMFKIPQEMGPNDWQIGFYDTKKDKITTFVILGNDISIRPEEEIFKKEEARVNEIELKKVNLNLESAVSRADEFQQKNFPKDRSVKTIVILQNLPDIGTIWNITYITEKFNTLNMKIDASNGRIVGHHHESIFSFKQKE